MCILGKVIKSNSHTDYLCQIFGEGEADYTPRNSDYSFGTFVKIDLDGHGDSYLTGVIYDTMLVNPDYGRLGPRLSPESELRIFSPDYLNERAVLVGILVIGQTINNVVQQGVPLLAATHEAFVCSMDMETIRQFHDNSGSLRLTYLPSVILQTGPLARNLALCVLGQLSKLRPETAPIVEAIADDLRWKLYVNSMRGNHE